MEKPDINFFSEDVKYILSDKRKSRQWIIQSIESECKMPGVVNFIFCSDEFLHKLNVNYLGHDTYTDIITFDMSDIENVIAGEVFISIERARENARKFGHPALQEVRRLMVHGVLHLIGYLDKKQEDKKLMTSKEDYYLSVHP